MNRTNCFQKLLISVLVLTAVCVFSFTALAAQTGFVKIVFQNDNEPISGVPFRLYQVALETENRTYQLTEAFAESQISLDDFEQEDMADLIAALSDYVAEHEGIPVYMESKTNSDGEASFENLPKGLYLLLGDEVTVDNIVYLPLPSVFFVPSSDLDGNTVYDITVMPKYERHELTERRVVKIWKDDGHTDMRPQEITVQLLCDGEVYDEQVLNESNNWSYTWSGLESEHDWQIAEVDVPKGYESSVTLDGVTFTVTNTYKTEETPSPSPEPTPSQTPGPDLPETGMLWWPVPVFAALGVILCVVGCLVYKEKDTK